MLERENKRTEIERICGNLRHTIWPINGQVSKQTNKQTSWLVGWLFLANQAAPVFVVLHMISLAAICFQVAFMLLLLFKFSARLPNECLRLMVVAGKSMGI